MKRPVDPQQELILAALYQRMVEDPELVDLFGDQPCPVVARLYRRDPIRVKHEDNRSRVEIERSGIPCLAVYTDGAVQYQGENMELMYKRTFAAEYVGWLPAATEELNKEEAGFVAASIVGAKMMQIMRDSTSLNDVGWDHIPICSEWIYDITPTNYTPYVLPKHSAFSVEMTLDVMHSESYPPYLFLESGAFPLTQVNTDMTHDAGSGEIEHDSDHEITT
jgi:hypothetical protein